MIYVNQKQLDQVEYLIEQSSRGFHALFEPDVIRDVFRIDAGSEEASKSSGSEERIESHIENLILQPTIVSKRAYLENLSPDVFRRVVKTYFSIVENNIFESLKFSQ